MKQKLSAQGAIELAECFETSVRKQHNLLFNVLCVGVEKQLQHLTGNQPAFSFYFTMGVG